MSEITYLISIRAFLLKVINLILLQKKGCSKTILKIELTTSPHTSKNTRLSKILFFCNPSFCVLTHDKTKSIIVLK